MINVIRTLIKKSPTSVTIDEVLEERLRDDQNGKSKAKELANGYRKREMDISRCRLRCTITHDGSPMFDALSNCDVIDKQSKVRYL